MTELPAGFVFEPAGPLLPEGFEITDDFEPAIAPGVADISARMSAAQGLADQGAMSHEAPVEESAPAWADVLATIPESVRANAAELIAGQRLRQLESKPVGLAAQAIDAGLADAPGDNSQAIADELAVLDEVAAEREALDLPGMTTAQRGVRGGVASLVTSAPALAIGLATRSPGMAATAMFPGTAASSYGQLRQEGVDPEIAGLHGNIQGAIESGTEFLLFAQLLKALPAGQMLLRTLAAELPSESLATLGQVTSDHVAHAQAAGLEVTPELVGEGLKIAAGQLPETWVSTIVATALQGGAVAGANRANQALAPKPQEYSLGAEDFAVPEGFQIVTETPVAEAAPPVAAEAIEAPLPAERVQQEVPAGFEIVDEDPTVELPPLKPAPYRVEQGEDGNFEAYDSAGERIGFGFGDEQMAREAAQQHVDEASTFERLKTDQPLREMLERMKNAAGWDTVGGKRLAVDELDGGSGKVTGRTVWLPRADWWPDRPGGFNAKQVGAIVDKALAGERLGSQQQALVRFMVSVATTSQRLKEFLPTDQELVSEGKLPATVDNRHEVAMAARAEQIDPEAFERLVMQYEDDDAGFMRAIKELVDAHDQNAADSGGRESGDEADEVSAARDLFGFDAEQGSALNKRNASLARRRGEGRVPVPADLAPPGDMFRDASDRASAEARAAQTDIEDEGVSAMRGAPSKPRTLREAVERKRGSVQAARGEDVEKIVWNPGAAHVPLFQSAGMPSSSANTVTLGERGQTQRTVTIPDKPIRRETAMRAIERAFGVKIYQGKPFKVRGALGFFRPKNFEVRVKSHNDLEVTAHEFFHWLDRTFDPIRALYHREEFRDELKGVSYDVKKLHEGFAEFGRLLLTQEAQAAAKAPKFYDAFMAKAKELGILGKLKGAQDIMHAWYLQGAEGRALSKIGPPPETFRESWEKATDGLADRELQRAADWLHSFKVVERTVTGKIQDATISPYGAARLFAGARGVSKAVLNYGTVKFNEQGDIVFSGPGLMSVFEPVADVFDETMAYFVGRRAEELLKQGREKLLAPDEIQALQSKARKSDKFPAIEKAFDEYQTFLDRMMEFYTQAGLVSKEGAAIMREMNKSYVPFNRIAESLEDPQGGKPRGRFMRLKGGTQNLRDTWENIVGSVQVLTSAALKNHAKRMLYDTIESGPKGQLFAVKLATEKHGTLVQPKRILEDIAKRLHSEGPEAWFAVQDVLTRMGTKPELAEPILYWSGKYQPSAPDVDSVLVDGEPRYYQIGDPLLMETLQLWNTPRPTNLGLKILGGFAGVLRRGITSMPDFLIPNLLRDTANAYALSKGGQVPFLGSVSGMVRAMKPGNDVWEFYANGGGFSSLLHADARPLRRKLERFYVDRKIDYKTVLDTPSKLLDVFDTFASAFEYGTRLAEFKAMRGKGASRRQAALEARDISTDFAMRGSSELLRWVTTSVAFMNARLQGLYRLQRETFEKDGKAFTFNPQQTMRFALRALIGLTIPSIFLWMRNKDDPRYKALPEWIKLTHWVFIVGDKAYLLPKPFEIGATFATIPEQTLEYIAEKDGEKYAEAIAFIVAQAFQLDPTPSAVKPLVDLARNKDFTGRPIMPEALQGVAPEEQFSSYTSETAIALGKKFGISPIKLDHLVRGYFGTLGMYALSTSDALVDPTLGTGERPSSKGSDMYVVRRFVRESPYHGTAQEQEFYKILDASREVAATFNKIKRDTRAQAAEAYLKPGDRRVLYAASRTIEGVAKAAAEINSGMRAVRLSNTMSADEKRAELDKLQIQKNRLFDAVALQLSRRRVQELGAEENARTTN